MAKAATKLTDKQKRFVQEYLIDLNATQAAIRAGYSEKTAYSQGQRLLKKPEVQEAIQKAMQKRAERTEITQDMVVQELAKVGFSNLDDFIKIQDDGVFILDFSGVDRGKLSAVSEITQDTHFEGNGDDSKEVLKTKFKLHDKVKGLTLLGKHLGMFREKVDHKVDGNLTINIKKYSSDGDA